MRPLLPPWALTRVRSSGPPEGASADGEALRVVRVDPEDGATGVFRDSPVLARLSRPAQGSSVSPETFRVRDPGGDVPARVHVSPDGRVVIWQAERLLVPDAHHLVVASGIRDRRGCEVARHVSRFLTGELGREDFSG